MALTKGQLIVYESIAKMQAAHVKNGKRIDVLNDGQFLTEATNNGGYLLASGNYANPYSPFGVGTIAAPLVTDWNNVRIGGVYQSVVASQSNTPNNAIAGWMGVVGSLNGDNTFQQIWKAGAQVTSVYTRYGSSSTWQPWVKMFTESDLNHLQNVSGGTVLSNGTIAGSSLNPSQTGTWRNVSGNDILDTYTGLWMKI